MNKDLLKMLLASIAIKEMERATSPNSSGSGKTIDMVETTQDTWERKTA